MVIQGIVVCCLLIVLPIILGMGIVDLCELGNWKMITKLIFCYIMGNIVQWALFQLITVPLVLMRTQFDVVIIIWSFAIAVCTIIVIWRIVKNKKNHENDRRKTSPKCKDIQLVVAVLVMTILIGMQCYIYIMYMHIDDDDSRYIVNALEAYENNIMFLKNPATGEYMGTWVGELAKDVISPWTMYIALIAKMCRIHPAVLAHTVLPSFLLLMSYGSIWLIGDAVFDGNKVLNSVIVSITAIINMYFTSSVRTQSYMTLTRIWQGKAVVASVIIPFILALLIHIYKDDIKYIYGLLTITCIGGCLLSGVGIFFSGIMIGVYGTYYNAIKRQYKNLLKVMVVCAPSVVYCLAYMIVK